MRPVRFTVITAAPPSLWPRELQPHTDRWLGVACDAGVVQADDLHVDAAATREAVARWERHAGGVRERVLAELAEGDDVDCIIGDVPPLAFEIAATLAVPSIAVANFSWDWIYGEMGLDAAAESARRAYERATLLVALTPSAPMDAFASRASMGVLGRRARADVEGVRRSLGLEPGERCVLLALRSPLLKQIELPPPEPGIRYLGPANTARPRADCIGLPPRLDFLDAFAVADAVLAKAGYGILGDCATNGIPLVWVRREGFPEDAVLAAWLEACDWASEVAPSALTSGSWGSALGNVWSRPRPTPVDGDVAAKAAGEISRLLD